MKRDSATVNELDKQGCRSLTSPVAPREQTLSKRRVGKQLYAEIFAGHLYSISLRRAMNQTVLDLIRFDSVPVARKRRTRYVMGSQPGLMPVVPHVPPKHDAPQQGASPNS